MHEATRVSRLERRGHGRGPGAGLGAGAAGDQAAGDAARLDLVRVRGELHQVHPAGAAGRLQGRRRGARRRHRQPDHRQRPQGATSRSPTSAPRCGRCRARRRSTRARSIPTSAACWAASTRCGSSAMLTEDYIKRTGNDTLEKALIVEPAAARHHEASGQHGAAGDAHGVRGRRSHLRPVQGQGRPDHPGRRGPDPADDARRPRRPLFRKRLAGPPGHAGGVAHGAGAVRRPAREVARHPRRRTA